MLSRLFISYSHFDESYVDDFRKHISPLKLNGTIAEWYDRKIIAGDTFRDVIDNNLESADIICLFISANFLSSDACIKEKEKSFLLKETHAVSVVPIILSECGWLDVKDISETLALPTDGHPIANYDDPNKGWKDVYDGLKKILERKNEEKSAVVKTTFANFLNDAEMLKSAHSQKTSVLLSDIFVFPNLSKFNYDDEKENTLKSENSFYDEFFKLKKILIAGESQSGKTTLCKTIFLKLRSRNLFPVYIFDKALRFDGLIKNRIETAFNEQYENINYLHIEKDKIVIMIDGFHFASSSQKVKILKDIEKYKYQIIFVDDIFSLNINDENLIKSFYRYSIDRYGPILRDELIKKWILLTDDKSYSIYQDNGFYKRLDSATDLVNNGLGKIIDKGIMPSYPFFIFSILSTHETFEKPLDQEITSQGYCYQALIYICLRKQGVKNDEIDIYLNFLSVLAYHFFSSNVSECSEDDFAVFLKDYNTKYYLPISVDTLLINLEAHRMLIKTKLNNYRFFYPYLYYYFVAKYLSDHLSEKKKEISQLIENLHKDENAYITIFISHHTKNYSLLDEIILNAMMLFENYKEATLSKAELNFFDNEIANVAKAALPKHTSPEIERRKRLEIQEQQEQQTSGRETSKEAMDDDAFSTSLRRSIRTVEVMGVITKNRIGSLEKQKLEEILAEAINVNLRILTSFFALIKDKQEQQEIVRFISSRLNEMRKDTKQNVSMEKLEKEAKKIFWNLNFGVILGYITKTIRSIGSDKLQKIIADICDKNKTPVHLLLKHGVFMWYGKNLQIDKLIRETKTIDISVTANEVLKYLIMYHCFFHNIDSASKQKIESKFGISSKGLIKIESKRK